MIPVDLVVSAPMAAALGFAYGIGPCLVSCAPFLGPVFLASDGGIRNSWRIIAPLSLGRIIAYGAFGALAGMLGHYVKNGIAANTVHLVLGCAALLMGLALLLRRPGPRCAAAVPQGTVPLRRIDAGDPARVLLPGGLFMMGIAMALSPCAPLGLVLFSAAMSGTTSGGLLLGLSFGLGAIVIPALVYGIGMAYLGTRLREQLRDWRPAIERLSALMLLAVGIGNLARW